MNFDDTLLTCSLILESRTVPLIIGDTGIGKTALLQQLAKDLSAHLITIDANLLKEGEIGGLPTLKDYPVVINGEKTSKKTTVYALHYKLLEIEKVLTKDPQKQIILFIDELNRCEHVVQQELMNLILNREINGYEIPDNVLVAAAMNPSNKYDNYSQSYYQVVDMDPAQEDRFVWIEMEANPECWLKWGTIKGKPIDGALVCNIHPDVQEFIANFPEFLHTLDSQESITASPRSWQRVSDAYYVYLQAKPKYSTNIFYNVIKGNVGMTAAQEFLNFLDNCRNPLLTPEEIFSHTKLSEELVAKVKLESHSRLYLTSKRCLNYLLELIPPREKEIRIFSELLKFYPSDLKMAVMQDIKLNYAENLYKDFLQTESFIDEYFQMYSYIA